MERKSSKSQSAAQEAREKALAEGRYNELHDKFMWNKFQG
jgi:hypothetical protein